MTQAFPPAPSGPAPSSEEELREECAGFWLRFVAVLLDAMILLIPSLLLGLCAKGIQGGEHVLFWKLILSNILGFLYTGLLQAQLEGTPGKKLVGIALVTEEFETLTLMQAIVRYFVRILGALCFGLGFLSVIWDKRKQGWHDRAAHSLVLRAAYVKRVRAAGQVAAA